MCPVNKALQPKRLKLRGKIQSIGEATVKDFVAITTVNCGLSLSSFKGAELYHFIKELIGRSVSFVLGYCEMSAICVVKNPCGMVNH